jgi:hypothetical protein
MAGQAHSALPSHPCLGRGSISSGELQHAPRQEGEGGGQGEVQLQVVASIIETACTRPRTAGRSPGRLWAGWQQQNWQQAVAAALTWHPVVQVGVAAPGDGVAPAGQLAAALGVVEEPGEAQHLLGGRGRV